jgi:enterochelin esterase-like enzyme
MKKSIVFEIVFITLFTHIAAGQNLLSESLVFHSHILGCDVKYSVSLPDDYYKSGNKYPVVYLLHGLGDDETSWLEYGRIRQSYDNAIKEKAIKPMILVMPQGFRSYYVNDYKGTFLYQDMFVKELVPFIDSVYRTIPDALHRGTMGYSMGGFGALILPLEHPEVFSACVPLSISIRTDNQYETEEASGWDEQWGRLFGGTGLTGDARITGYYRKHSPFHILSDSDPARFNSLRIYIANGDDEQTLCRSNEELHMLMRSKGIKHEYRVSDGGHDFIFWRAQMTNGLNFLDDAFNNRKYRRDNISSYNFKSAEKTQVTMYDRDGLSFSISLPAGYNISDRKYPVLFFIGDFDNAQKKEIASMINSMTEKEIMPPVLSIFTGSGDSKPLQLIPLLEKSFRARTGYRYRALLAYGSCGAEALNTALDSLRFTCVSLFNITPDINSIEKATSDKNNEVLRRTWLYLEAPADGESYKENGEAHIILRENDIYHEYRVTGGDGSFRWFIENLPESLIFAQKKIHR